MQRRIKNIFTQSDFCQKSKDKVGQVWQKKLTIFFFAFMLN